ncbi:hypothetical protein M885DRAFT_436352 [Pelagophyceae sp. CCMP2097]|nr:hypothetical protein M885DRAFT_436352 [Pelagophyceae sp. CCMP2097]
MYCGVPLESLVQTGKLGLSDAEAAERLSKFGPNALEDKKVHPLKKLALNFVSPMALMIWMAIIIEAVIQDWPNIIVLTTLQVLNAVIGWYEDMKAGDAVAALKASLKAHASVCRGGVYSTIDGADVVVGDRIVLHAGGAVPADCRLDADFKGELEIDQAALTGESMPAKMRCGDEPKMGSNCVRGEAEAVVIATGGQTFFGKTASMINRVHEISHFDKIIIAITKALLAGSTLLVAISLIVLLLRGAPPLEALAFAVVLLVASIPIALPVVSVTTMALGARALARKEAIVTRLSSIEEVAGMTVLCSDKTGTLTMNKMVLQEELPIFTPGVSRDQVLVHAALAAKWREPPKDALDTLVLGAAELRLCDAYEQVEYLPFDPRTKRTEATLKPKGSPAPAFKCSKGAPHIILSLCAPGPELKERVEGIIETLSKRGVRSLAVARTNDVAMESWELLGILTFLDPPRPDTAATIKRANELGVQVKMITGDHIAIAIDMANQLHMGTKIQGCDGLPNFDPNGGKIPRDLGERYGEMIERADGFAGVFPEHKFLIVEVLQQRGWLVGMTGDGVNDAPALKKAGVGIAVSGSTDAARAAADIVLTNDGLSTIIDAIVIARTIFQRMKNYVVYRVACTTQLLLFFFITVCFVHPDKYAGWADFDDEEAPPNSFSLPVIVLVLITILNDGTIISIAYDAVKPSKLPEKWRLPQTFAIAFFLGGVACVSSLVILHFMLQSRLDGSLWRHAGLPRMSYGELSCAMYLKISVSDFLTVFSARTRGPFWSRAPGTFLFFAAFVATLLSTIITLCWNPGYGGMEPVGATVVAFVWAYDVFFFLVQDFTKVYFILLINWYTGENEDEHKLDSDEEPPESIISFYRRFHSRHLASGQPAGDHYQRLENGGAGNHAGVL